MPLFLLRCAALSLTFWVGGCSLIDDFGQFRIEGDRMPRDGGPDDDDAGAEADASVPCGSDDCARLNRRAPAAKGSAASAMAGRPRQVRAGCGGAPTSARSAPTARATPQGCSAVRRAVSAVPAPE